MDSCAATDDAPPLSNPVLGAVRWDDSDEGENFEAPAALRRHGGRSGSDGKARLYLDAYDLTIFNMKDS